MQRSLSFPILGWDQRQESLAFDSRDKSRLWCGRKLGFKPQKAWTHSFDWHPSIHDSWNSFLTKFPPSRRWSFIICSKYLFSYLASNDYLTSKAVHTWLKLNGCRESGILSEKNFVRFLNFLLILDELLNILGVILFNKQKRLLVVFFKSAFSLVLKIQILWWSNEFSRFRSRMGLVSVLVYIWDTWD